MLFTGIGPLLAWGRLSAERGAAAAALAGARGRWRRSSCCWRSATPATIPGRCSSSPSPPSRWSRSAGEFWRAGVDAARAHRRAATRARSRSAVGRNRRRYGGYIVHAGIALPLIGIAASSSFQTNRDLRLQVGQSAKVGDYTVHYDKLTTDPEQRADRVRRPARRHPRRQAGRHPRPGAQLLPDPGPDRRGRSAATSWASRPARSACRRGAGGDLWTAFQPDLSSLNPDDRARQPPARGPAADAQGIAILALAQHYVADPPPANFRVIVNPLVGWIWIGGADRRRRGGDGGLAGARVAPPAGGGLPGQARPGAGDGHTAELRRFGRAARLAPSLTAPCWSSCSPSPSSCWSPGS